VHPGRFDAAAFGKVIANHDIVKNLGRTPTDHEDRPTPPIRMDKVTIAST
jgi:cyclophilin family peptidyl-prolyl cis-trans isomerase